MPIAIKASLPALAIALGSCGSQAQYDRNHRAIEEQLAVINATTPENAGYGRASGVLLGPTPDQVGQRMRATSAHPPS